ncbi:hypothetical protein GCM10010417_03530 [Streptomyces carpaticus]
MPVLPVLPVLPSSPSPVLASPIAHWSAQYGQWVSVMSVIAGLMVAILRRPCYTGPAPELRPRRALLTPGTRPPVNAGHGIGDTRATQRQRQGLRLAA